MTETSGPAVRAHQLVKTYDGREGTVEAVRGVDLEVRAGEIFGFLGPNGAGKSTTVRMLTTLLTITAGPARGGRHRRRRRPRRRPRAGSASRSRRPGSTRARPGRELLTLHGRLFGIDTAEAAKARAEELLALVELEDAADRVIKGYSGGMERRLDLAAALVHEPEVLFLDEPTTGLDPASRLTVWEELRRINGQGTTIFLTTQYLEEADQLCDRLAIIDDGRIVREGTPDALKAELRDAHRRSATRRSTTCSSTRPAAPATAPPARSRRWRHERHGRSLGAQRALREALRQPDALFMTLFIPIFFLVVNTGQAAEIFPSDSTGFLEGQGYGAFQLPITLLLAASFGMAALFLVEEIEGGYFDKLRAIPIPRYSIVLGRLVAEGAKGVVISTVIVLLALPFGITIASGVLGLRPAGALTALLGRRLRRLHAADRAQDAQRGGDQLGRADLLPAAVPDAELRPARHADASRWRSRPRSTPSPT